MGWNIEVLDEHGVVLVTMSQSFVSHDFLHDANTCCGQLESSPRYAGLPVVFTGSGTIFNAGLDLRVFASSSSALVVREYLTTVEATVLRMAQLPVRTVAAICILNEASSIALVARAVASCCSVTASRPSGRHCCVPLRASGGRCDMPVTTSSTNREKRPSHDPSSADDDAVAPPRYLSAERSTLY